MKIQIKVSPNSKENKVIKLDKTHYKVKVNVAPEKGRANQKVKEVLADFFKVKKYQVEIISGHTISDKFIEIKGVD